MEIIKTIVHREGNRKVEIFRRQDRTFGFKELKWLDTPENCWVLFGKYPTAVIETLDHAIEEVKSRVSWLAASK
jgi:hypothetical protein